jgi:hypothetical protein
LKSGHTYPRDKKAVVISSWGRINGTEGWEDGQRALAEEVTSEEALVRWIKVDTGSHWVCEGRGRGVCMEAVRNLIGM